MRMWVLGMERTGQVPKLNEVMAIELGANMIGEGIMFGVAASILVYEYNRSSGKEEAREAQQQQRLAELDARLEDLQFTVEEQESRIRELYRELGRPVPQVPSSRPVPQRTGREAGRGAAVNPAVS